MGQSSYFHSRNGDNPFIENRPNSTFLKHKKQAYLLRYGKIAKVLSQKQNRRDHGQADE
jgi:hypothetical protein